MAVLAWFVLGGLAGFFLAALLSVSAFEEKEEKIAQLEQKLMEAQKHIATLQRRIMEQGSTIAALAKREERE